jgi:succinate dehydrogenase subunit D
MAKRRAEPEPLLWLLFSSGGLAAALLLPVLLVLFGLVFPAGWVSAPSQAHLLSVARFPLTRIVLLGLFVLALFHWAHRFRYTLYEGLQLKHLSPLIILGCYGGALAGSAIAGYLLLPGL